MLSIDGSCRKYILQDEKGIRSNPGAVPATVSPLEDVSHQATIRESVWEGDTSGKPGDLPQSMIISKLREKAWENDQHC